MNTNEEIVRAAIKIFSQKGMAATMKDVAHMAGVQENCLFKRFHSKDELILCVFRFFWELVLKEAVAIRDALMPVRLEDSVTLTCQFMLREKDLVRAFYSCHVSPKNNFSTKEVFALWEEIEKLEQATWQILDDVVAKKQAAGEIMDKIKPSIIRQMLAGLYTYMLYRELFLDSEGEAEGLIESLKNVVQQFFRP